MIKGRVRAAVTIILTVMAGFQVPEAAASNYVRYGDCRELQPPQSSVSFDRQCDTEKSFDCAIGMAMDTVNAIDRCDRKILSLAFIGGSITNTGAIHGEIRKATGQRFIMEMIRNLEKVPNPDIRTFVAWGTSLSIMETGDYAAARELASHLPPWANSTIHSYGALMAAKKCDASIARDLLERADHMAAHVTTGWWKVRAYSWIARVQFLLGMEEFGTSIDLAKQTMEEIPGGRNSEWGKVFYGIGLTHVGRPREAISISENLKDPYHAAYVLSFSASSLAFRNKGEEARKIMKRADGVLSTLEDNYQRDSLKAVLAPARVLIGDASGISDIVDSFSRSRALTRVGNVLFDQKMGVLPWSCGSI